MDFTYIIFYFTEDGKEIERTGTGQFYPTNLPLIKLEDVLWQMAEQYGRPTDVEIHMAFTGEITDGTGTTKRLEAPKTKKDAP